MCPITMGVIAATAGLASIGVGVYSNIQQGKFQKDMGKYQASVARERAKQATIAGKFEAEKASLRARQVVGAGKVGVAANGVLLEGTEGSGAAMWEQDQSAMLAMEKESIMANANAQAWTFGENANMALAQGSAAQSSANWAAAGSVLAGAPGVLAAGGDAYAAYQAAYPAQ